MPFWFGKKLKWIFLVVILAIFLSPRAALSASITGFKFEDVNSDRIRQTNEPKLAGWVIRLFSIDINERPFDPSNPKLGPQVAEATTGASGDYLFSVSPGQYGVCEELQSGWVQTFPEKCHLVIVSGDEVIRGDNFGNFRSASISGIKWNDIDRDGIKSSTESGIPNWRIFIDTNENQSFDLNEESILTDAGGNYSFGGLSPGSHSVCEETRPGWDRTYPAEGPCQDVTITTSGGNIIADFGNRSRTSISACKYLDSNFNRRLDSGESPISGITISLYRKELIPSPYYPGKVVSRWLLRQSGQTEASGCIVFNDLQAGYYKVVENIPRGYIPTFPFLPKYLLTIAEGDTPSVIFLNAKTRKFKNTN